MAHVVNYLRDPNGWVLYLAEGRPRRLIVFVHGFGGKAVGTWSDIVKTIAGDPDWESSDLLFVGYPSFRSNISGTATVLRNELDRFFPILDSDLRDIAGLAVRTDDAYYDELVLVGHSLGGVILRQALLQARTAEADGDYDGRRVPGTAILAGRLTLFSPAIAGFKPSGWLGMIRETGIWIVANAVLRGAATYSELQPDSPILKEVRKRTTKLIDDPDSPNFDHRLRARILWANPDGVVNALSYDGDYADEVISGKSHIAMCKSRADYTRPQQFIDGE